jgi:hypothetical protein
MTEFKIGDKVLVKPGEVSLTGWTPEDYTTPLPVTHVDDYGRVVSLAGVLEYSFRPEQLTPAPLDPSKVKPGDTVTLTVDPPDTHPAFTVAGETHTLGGSAVYVGGWRVDDLPDYVTLTAHQPAPEPEPEWTDGTVAEVTYNNADETEQFKTRALRGDGSWVPFADVSDLIMDDEVTDVRPLVVIDPAEVDVDAIIRVAKDFYQFNPKADGVSPVEVGVRYVLEHLGLNR